MTSSLTQLTDTILGQETKMCPSLRLTTSSTNGTQIERLNLLHDLAKSAPHLDEAHDPMYGPAVGRKRFSSIWW